MNNILAKLKLGINYFGSSSYNTPEFNDFYKDFVKFIKSELKKINASNIEIYKGHFYLYGFFTVDKQWYYFNLPDVRHSIFKYDTLMYRKCKDNKDYTGETNMFRTIKENMFLEEFDKGVL